MHPKVFLHASRNNLRQTCFFSSFRFCYYEFTRSLFFFHHAFPRPDHTLVSAIRALWTGSTQAQPVQGFVNVKS